MRLAAEGEPSLVSVVVPNYNGAAYLADCLASLRVQTYEPIEIVVVDDASTDGSAAIVPTTDVDTRLIQLPANRGFAHAANRGMEAARGSTIALLNNDAVAEPGWVEELVGALERHRNA